MTEFRPGTSPPPVRMPIRLAAMAVCAPLETAVGVKSPEEQVAAEIREHDRAEADDKDQRCRSAGPATLAARVQVDGVDKPGDESRRFLGIPAPVAAPRDGRP